MRINAMLRLPEELNKEIGDLHKKFDAHIGAKTTRTAFIIKLLRIGLDNFYMPGN